MITQKEFDKLYKANAADKRALDMLDNLKCAYGTYAEFQMAALKVSEKLNAPTGSLGVLCALSAQSRKDAQDMYRLWYESIDVMPLSSDVYKAVTDAYNDIKFDNQF